MEKLVIKVSRKTEYTVAEILTSVSGLVSAEHRHAAHLGRALGIGTSDTAAIHHLARQDLTPTQLAERLGVSSGSLTAIADRLEHLGFLSRQRHPTDRRSVVLTLTTRGHARTYQEIEGFIAALTHVAGRLSAGERTIVGQFLDALSGLTETHAPTAGD